MSEPEGLLGVSENLRGPPSGCYHPTRGGAAVGGPRNCRLELW